MRETEYMGIERIHKKESIFNTTEEYISLVLFKLKQNVHNSVRVGKGLELLFVYISRFLVIHPYICVFTLTK